MFYILESRNVNPKNTQVYIHKRKIVLYYFKYLQVNTFI